MVASANPAISEATVECPSIGAQLVEAPPKAVCKAPGKLGGTDRFAAWIRSLSPAELDDISSSFVKWKEAELQWLKLHEKRKPVLFESKQAKQRATQH